MNQKSDPIGIFDSGVGGVSVLREIYKQLPYENTVYLADHIHFPYSEKPAELIKEYVLDIINFLINNKTKIIIIACNVATSIALKDTRDIYKIPIIGVIEPGAKSAVKVTKNKSIGVLGGKKVEEVYREVHKSLDSDIKTFGYPCPDFAKFVEQGLSDPKEIQETAYSYLKNIKEKDIDTLIFGCTHYPFLKDFVKEVVGPNIKLVDPSQETVESAREILKKHELLNEKIKKEAAHIFFISGNKPDFKFVAEKLLNEKVDKVVQNIQL